MGDITFHKGNENSIKEIFKSMDEGTDVDDLHQAKEWLNAREKSFFAFIEKTSEAPNGILFNLKDYIENQDICTIYLTEIDKIKTILENTDKDTKWGIDSFEYATAMENLGLEIEKNAQLLAQIECITRGVHVTATKEKLVPLLAQYFYYYSSFPIKCSHMNPDFKPKGVAVGIIPDDNSVLHVGLFLGPVLAARYNIVLQVGPKIAPVTFLISELMRKVGFPEHVLRIIPSDDGELLPYLISEKVTLITLFVDLHEEKYRGINSLNKKIIYLSPCRIPTIVFDNADIDSAILSIIEAAWINSVPWPPNTILVQENIFSTFVNKLKTKMKKLRVGHGNDRMVNVSRLDERSANNLRIVVEQAKAHGIEVFQVAENENKWTPTLLIGSEIENSYNENSRILHVSTFRTVQDIVGLTNNKRQGLGASLWSENIGVINEVSKKLNVSNIWVNDTSGLIPPDVTFFPIRESGVGYFGGKQGFDEYIDIEKNHLATTDININVPQHLDFAVIDMINKAKQAQQTWSKLSRLVREKYIRQIGEDFHNNKKNPNWVNAIFQCILKPYDKSFVREDSGFSLTSLRLPRGVLAIETNDLTPPYINLIILALIEGNSVILLNEFALQLAPHLPARILNYASCQLSVIKSIVSHNDVALYFGNSNGVRSILPLKHTKIFTGVSNSLEETYEKVTITKNIWSDIGKSSSYK